MCLTLIRASRRILRALGIGVTVARLTLDQLVQVRILDPQFFFSLDGRMPMEGLEHPFLGMTVRLPTTNLGNRASWGDEEDSAKEGLRVGATTSEQACTNPSVHGRRRRIGTTFVCAAG